MNVDNILAIEFALLSSAYFLMLIIYVCLLINKDSIQYNNRINECIATAEGK